MMLPWPASRGGDARVPLMAEMLPRVLKDCDIVVVCELISRKRGRALLSLLQSVWPCQSKTPTAATRLVNGGVRIISKLPIIAQKTMVYALPIQLCSDMLAAKGVVYVQLATPSGAPLHLFATHMHAPEGSTGDRIRTRQAAELRRFIAQQHIPANEPVFVCGDLNHDLDSPDTHNTLCTRDVDAWKGELRHTLHERTNTLVGCDGYCKRGDGSCKDQLVDGVLAHRDYAPVHVMAEIRQVKDGGGNDLSDHHAFVATVTIPSAGGGRPANTGIAAASSESPQPGPLHMPVWQVPN